LFVAAPLHCKSAEVIDWPNAWDRDDVHVSRADTVENMP
jgi:hypothetical protein